MPFLKYVSPTRGEVWLEIGGKPVTIGRSASCALTVDDDSASRRHCEVRYAKGKFFVVDLKSKNGTKLNGMTVKVEKELAEGDLISLSNSSIEFRLERKHE